MRLTRTVVVGKQKDLVQRILYVLTYFLRCSELQENQLTWSGNHGEGEQVLNGSNITTALERGEVEESEYVVVTVRSEPALLPPVLPPALAEGWSPGPDRPAAAPEGTDIRDLWSRPNKEGNQRPDQNSEACSMRVQEPATDSSWEPQGALCRDEKSKNEAPQGSSSRLSSCEGLGAGLKVSQQTVGEELTGAMPKKALERSAAWPCPDRHPRERPPLQKVTFQIGSSVSPESDFESRTNTMEERLTACRQYPEPASCPLATSREAAAPAPARDQRVSGRPLPHGPRRNVRGPQSQSPDGGAGAFGKGFPGDRGSRTEAAAGAAGQLRRCAEPRAPRGGVAGPGVSGPEGAADLRLKAAEGAPTEPVPGGRAQQDSGLSAAAAASGGATAGKADFRAAGDLPRNESSDSALGDSDDEACASAPPNLGPSGDGTEGALEVELPLPR